MRNGLPMRGSCGVFVTVRNAHADLSAMTDSDNHLSLSLSSNEQHGRPTRVYLSFMCLLLERAGRKATLLLKQVVWHISNTTESKAPSWAHA